MSEHLTQRRILEIGLGESTSLSEKAHIDSCGACRGLVDAEIALGSLIATAGEVRLPARFVENATARFERALVWRRLFGIATVLVFSCVPGGLIAWLTLANLHRVVGWMIDVARAVGVLGRALSSLSTTLPVTSAVVLCSMALTCVLSAYLLAWMIRRPATVKYRGAPRVFR